MSPIGLLAAAGASAAAPDLSIGHLLLQMVVAMVLVVGGIWGFGKLMGRSRVAGRNAGRAAGGFFRSRLVGREPAAGLTVLSRQPVGKGKFLAVVQVGAQQFLVGIADSGLTPLGELHAGDPEPVPDEEPLPVAAHHGVVPGPSAEFGPAELAAVDLSALGLRPLDLDAAPVRVGGTGSPRAAARPVGPAPARRPAPARPVGPAPAPARRAAPAPARRAAPEGQPSRSVRSLVESLREATVRR